MLHDFFLERARIEIAADGASYDGSVPDLPEIHVNAASFDECRARVARAIADLLDSDARNSRITLSRTATRSPEEVLPTQAATAGQLHDFVNEGRAKVEKAPVAQGHSGHDFADILYEKRDWVARVTINRPEVYNAYTGDTLREMTQAFRDAALDRSVAFDTIDGWAHPDVRALVAEGCRRVGLRPWVTKVVADLEGRSGQAVFD